MKKYFYLFLSLFTVVLVSCNQNNPSDPSNPNDPENPSNPSGTFKVKYLLESGSWFTYQDESNGTHWSSPLNVVSKTVEERGSEAKYLRSRSTYEGDELKLKYTYQNESDRDYSWLIFPAGNESSKDTVIWYDDARTKVKEQKNGSYHYVYGYDSQHHDRQIYTKVYHAGTGKIWMESEYTYSGLIQNGETKFYDVDGTLYIIQKSVAEYKNDWYSQYKYYNTKSYSYPSNVLNNTSKTKYEWNGDLFTKQESNYESFDQNGNLILTSRTVVTYNWSDELNNTSTTEYYQGNNLFYRQAGYAKYTY